VSIDKDVLKSRQKIKDLIDKSENEICDALLRGDREEVASLTYLVAEYEQMLEEFDVHHNISKS